MNIAGAGLNQTPLNWEQNTKNICDAILEARKKQINLLCLSELTITGYGCEDMFLYPWVSNRSIDQLKQIAPFVENIAVAVGLPMHFQEGIYNVACIIQNKEIKGFVAKQHLARDGVHYEPRWFDPWPKGHKDQFLIDEKAIPFGDLVFDIDEATVGFEICEDAWVKDRPGVALADKNVDIILNLSASHFAIAKSHEREQMVVSASSEFDCYYLYVNQLGNESGRVIYDGDVIIAGHGRLIANSIRLTLSSFQMASTEIDLGSSKHGKPSTYVKHESDNEQFSAAVVLGLYDYLRKSNCRGFVLSLSGGADSSACLVLVVEMIRRGIDAHGLKGFLMSIGRDDLLDSGLSTEEVVNQLIACAYQSTQFSSNETYLSASELASSVNARFYSWSIDEEVEKVKNTIEKVTGKKMSWEEDDVTLQNIQARTRSPLIWTLANKEQAILISTSNRSEGSVGYATIDGDTSGGLAPLAGIDKSFLLQWLPWAKDKLGYHGLERVIGLDPTAELRPHKLRQTDEKDLMPYSVLNHIELLFVYYRLSPLEIFDKIKSEMSEANAANYIIKFFRLWSKSQWKRERIAPSFQLSEHNIDPKSWFRFPILSSGFKEELNQIHQFCS